MKEFHKGFFAALTKAPAKAGHTPPDIVVRPASSERKVALAGLRSGLRLIGLGVLLVGACGTLMASGNANLLLNPGFEDGPATPVQNWTLWRAPWGTGETAEATTVSHVGGSRSLLLFCNSSSFGVYQEVSVTPGRCYQLNGWWKGSFPIGPGKTSWFDTELLDGPFDYQTADLRPYDLPTKVCSYDPAIAVWDWQQMSDAYSTAPECINGTRAATGSTMTVVLKTGGFSVPLGYYDDISLTEVPPLTINEARAQPDGAAVSLESERVSAAFSGFFYLESGDRSVGLRVVSSSLPAVGSRASVAGYMRTNADGERYLDAGYASFESASDAPAPFGMVCGDVGGAATPDYDAQTGAGQAGISAGNGANNIGLLVSVTARVVSLDSPGIVTVADEAETAVRIVLPPGAPPTPVATLLHVTGVSSCYLDGQTVRAQILSRDSADLQILSP